MTNYPEAIRTPSLNKWLLAVALFCQLFAFAGFSSPALTRLARAEQTELVLKDRPAAPKSISSKRATASYYQNRLGTSDKPNVKQLSSLYDRLQKVKVKSRLGKVTAFKLPVFRPLKTNPTDSDGNFMHAA